MHRQILKILMMIFIIIFLIHVGTNQIETANNTQYQTAKALGLTSEVALNKEAVETIASAQNANISKTDSASIYHDDAEPEALAFQQGAGITSDLVLPKSLTRAEPKVSMQAGSGATILFKTNNGRMVNNVPSQSMIIPHLILYRNGTLTAAAERTLIVTITGIQVPAEGAMVTLQLWTQHGDPDQGPFKEEESLLVWQESKPIQATQDILIEATAVFWHEFADFEFSGREWIPTPTDYYRYILIISGLDHPGSKPLLILDQDHALLMESQWRTRLPKIENAPEGIAPEELVIYYCDMFPFWKIYHDVSTWLPRQEVTNYIQTELVPAMVRIYHEQVNEWGFPRISTWNNHRPGEDMKQLSVALTNGPTWFHGRAPARASSRISIRASLQDNASYETITDSIMSTFHHELFHNLQLNLSQGRFERNDLSGADGRWQFFSEGTATLATSIGQPAVQFSKTTEARAYMSRANEFLGGDGSRSGLNTSYKELVPYQAAFYWRFLYEQCGGLKNGVENPAEGLKIIWQTLMTLYATDIVDIRSSSDIVKTMPLLMNQVFSNLDESLCPFGNYEESLVNFARAIYSLGIDGGRCVQPGLPVECGFYDPFFLYEDPPVSTIIYAGSTLTYGGADQLETIGIGSSFGMDFVDVILDPAANGKPLQLEFFGTPGVAAVFSIQLWKLTDANGEAQPKPISSHPRPVVLRPTGQPDGHFIYCVPEIKTNEYNRLGLIITRIDAQESSDPTGQYTIHLNEGC